MLIHGNYGDRRYWDAQFSALGQRHRVLRYDLLGFGASSAPITTSVSGRCETLSFLLHALNIPKAHIVGFSMGSSIALEFALRYPESTTTLVSVGPWVAGYNSVATSAAFNDYRQDVTALMRVLHLHGTDAAAQYLMNVTFAETILDDSTRDIVSRLVGEYAWWLQTNSLSEFFAGTTR